jgi:hypothetical protein
MDFSRDWKDFSWDIYQWKESPRWNKQTWMTRVWNGWESILTLVPNDKSGDWVVRCENLTTHEVIDAGKKCHNLNVAMLVAFKTIEKQRCGDGPELLAAFEAWFNQFKRSFSTKDTFEICKEKYGE